MASTGEEALRFKDPLVRGENSARRSPDPARGASAVFATDQPQAAPEWTMKMGTPLAHEPATPSSLSLTLPTPTQGAKRLVTRGATCATPTPTGDGVCRNW
jgi:hypothetical protein